MAVLDTVIRYLMIFLQSLQNQIEILTEYYLNFDHPKFVFLDFKNPTVGVWII